MNKQLLSVAAIAALGVAGTAVAGEAGQYYTKIDAGYSISSRQEVKGVDFIDNSSFSKGYRGVNVGLGLGYNITDCTRVDVTVQYSNLINRRKKISGQNVYPPFMGVDSFRSMVNVYYDFVNDSDIVPFVTAGIGIDSSVYKYD